MTTLDEYDDRISRRSLSEANQDAGELLDIARNLTERLASRDAAISRLEGRVDEVCADIRRVLDRFELPDGAETILAIHGYRAAEECTCRQAYHFDTRCPRHAALAGVGQPDGYCVCDDGRPARDCGIRQHRELAGVGQPEPKPDEPYPNVCAACGMQDDHAVDCEWVGQ